MAEYIIRGRKAFLVLHDLYSNDNVLGFLSKLIKAYTHDRIVISADAIFTESSVNEILLLRECSNSFRNSISYSIIDIENEIDDHKSNRYISDEVMNESLEYYRHIQSLMKAYKRDNIIEKVLQPDIQYYLAC